MQTILDISQNLSGAGGLETIKHLTSALINNGSNLIFFQQINGFLNDQILKFGVSLLKNTMTWVGSVALVLMTIWIMIQGYRIMTGQSRESMMLLVTNSLRATLIMAIATGWGVASPTLFNSVTSGLQESITYVVTGDTKDVNKLIDENLGYMQLAFSSIDALQDGASPIAGDQKSRAMWFTGIGTGGPAITAGVMLLLNKIALALFSGLGPIFILCLLFDQTKQLFSRWLFYGVGTMFSLGVLSVMVAIALKVVKAVSIAFWVNTFIGGSNEGVNSMAMQQGGLGLVMTMLIISAPPMAAAFFQGTLGQFSAYSQFGGSAGTQPGVRGTGSPPMNTSGTYNAQPQNMESGAREVWNQSVPSQLTQQRAGSFQSTGNEIRGPAEARLGNAGQQQLANSVSPLGPTETTSPPSAPVRPTGGNKGG